MARFAFRLEQLLDLRRRGRDAVRQRFAVELAALAQVRARQDALDAERAEHHAEIGTLSAGGRLDVGKLVRRRAYVASLDERLRGVAVEQARVEAEVARRRAALTEAEREVRLLERLREKQQAEFDAEQQQHEAREREEAWLARHVGDAQS